MPKAKCYFANGLYWKSGIDFFGPKKINSYFLREQQGVESFDGGLEVSRYREILEELIPEPMATGPL